MFQSGKQCSSEVLLKVRLKFGKWPKLIFQSKSRCNHIIFKAQSIKFSLYSFLMIWTKYLWKCTVDDANKRMKADKQFVCIFKTFIFKLYILYVLFIQKLLIFLKTKMINKMLYLDIKYRFNAMFNIISRKFIMQ